MKIFNLFLLFGRKIYLISITVSYTNPKWWLLYRNVFFLTALCGEIRTLSLTVAHRRTETVYRAFCDEGNHDNIILSSGISNLWQVVFSFWSATSNCFLVDLWTPNGEWISDWNQTGFPYLSWIPLKGKYSLCVILCGFLIPSALDLFLHTFPWKILMIKNN